MCEICRQRERMERHEWDPLFVAASERLDRTTQIVAGVDHLPAEVVDGLSQRVDGDALRQGYALQAGLPFEDLAVNELVQMTHFAQAVTDGAEMGETVRGIVSQSLMFGWLLRDEQLRQSGEEEARLREGIERASGISDDGETPA